VVVGELKAVVPLDAGEFGIGQAGSDVMPARPRQPAGGFLAQSRRVAADHAGKDNAASIRLPLDLLPARGGSRQDEHREAWQADGVVRRGAMRRTEALATGLQRNPARHGWPAELRRVQQDAESAQPRSG